MFDVNVDYRIIDNQRMEICTCQPYNYYRILPVKILTSFIFALNSYFSHNVANSHKGLRIETSRHYPVHRLPKAHAVTNGFSYVKLLMNDIFWHWKRLKEKNNLFQFDATSLVHFCSFICRLTHDNEVEQAFTFWLRNLPKECPV